MYSHRPKTSVAHTLRRARGPILGSLPRVKFGKGLNQIPLRVLAHCVLVGTLVACADTPAVSDGGPADAGLAALRVEVGPESLTVSAIAPGEFALILTEASALSEPVSLSFEAGSLHVSVRGAIPTKQGDSVLIRVSADESTPPGDQVLLITALSGDAKAGASKSIRVVPQPSVAGDLSVVSIGLPDGARTALTLTTSDGGIQQPSGPSTWTALAPGTYFLSAEAVQETGPVSGRTFVPRDARTEIEIAPSTRTTKEVLFDVLAGSGTIYVGTYSLSQGESAITAFASTAFDASGTPLPLGLTVLPACNLHWVRLGRGGDVWAHCGEVGRPLETLRRYAARSLVAGQATPLTTIEFASPSRSFVDQSGGVWRWAASSSVIEIISESEALALSGTSPWPMFNRVLALPTPSDVPWTLLSDGALVTFNDSSRVISRFAASAVATANGQLTPETTLSTSAAVMDAIFQSGDRIWFGGGLDLSGGEASQLLTPGTRPAATTFERHLLPPHQGFGGRHVMVDDRGDSWFMSPSSCEFARMSRGDRDSSEIATDIDAGVIVGLTRRFADERLVTSWIW